MSPEQRAETWRKIAELLREYEDAETAAAKTAITERYESLRTRLQVVALEESSGGETA